MTAPQISGNLSQSGSGSAQEKLEARFKAPFMKEDKIAHIVDPASNSAGEFPKGESTGQTGKHIFCQSEGLSSPLSKKKSVLLNGNGSRTAEISTPTPRQPNPVGNSNSEGKQANLRNISTSSAGLWKVPSLEEMERRKRLKEARAESFRC
eukprot:CAMPEP_0184502808 /NCGR_PEP_ID=MMETSP0113_2-20130426/51282_1 /TAXON_ID=91329 /ORGANISM="Norrisiella sphaerica, Strain BC52" /LENGTH=150 /DNA_ID=CAMNT_0026892145 /DNA_START=129 /DNA_END=581 /DNA_ORIENTATION=+